MPSMRAEHVIGSCLVFGDPAGVTETEVVRAAAYESDLATALAANPLAAQAFCRSADPAAAGSCNR